MESLPSQKVVSVVGIAFTEILPQKEEGVLNCERLF